MRLEIKAVNIDKIAERLERAAVDSEKAVQRISSDMKTRVPPIVAKEVTQRYNIAQKRIKPDKGKPLAGSVGRLSVRGKKLTDLKFIYSGRPIVPTPETFKLTPKTPPTKRAKQKKRIPGERVNFRRSGKSHGVVGMVSPPAPYKTTVTILKGQKKTLPANTFVARGSASISATVLPFIRVRKENNPRAIRPAYTVSLPQMVDNQNVKPKIEDKVMELLNKRAEHHLKNIL